MDLITTIKEIAGAIGAGLEQEKGGYLLKYLVAERKTFLSRKKLVYKARFRLEESQRELHFSETLQETGFGLGASAGDSDIGPGIGFKAEGYKSGLPGREVSIKEQSDFFGKKYQYQFELGEIRNKIEKAAAEAGYRFIYKITPP
jgi:hypothetical protein